MTDHGWPPLQSDLEVSDVLRAVEDEKERAHYDEEAGCSHEWVYDADYDVTLCRKCGDLDE